MIPLVVATTSADNRSLSRSSLTGNTSAGITRVYAYVDRESWSAGAAEALAGRGPVVIWLRIEARLGQGTPAPPRPMAEQIASVSGLRWPITRISLMQAAAA